MKGGIYMAPLEPLVRWRPWGLRRLEPFKELEEMSEEMGRFFEEFVDRPWFPALMRRPLARREWTPAIEMIDKKDEVLVRAEMPGIDKKDIHVSVAGDILTIKGERKAREEVKEENYYRCEFAYGSFSRSVSLPAGIETEKIKAECKDGILEVHLPRTKEVKETAKEITVE
jgi:HSP20 family protein